MDIDKYAQSYFPHIGSLWFFSHEQLIKYRISIRDIERYLAELSEKCPFNASRPDWSKIILGLVDHYPQFFEGNFREGIKLINYEQFREYFEGQIRENHSDLTFAVNDKTHRHIRMHALVFADDIVRTHQRKEEMHIPVKEFIDIMLWEKNHSRVVELDLFLWALHLCNSQTSGVGMGNLNPEGYYVTTDYNASTIRSACHRTGFELYTPSDMDRISVPMDYVVCTKDRVSDPADLYDEDSEQYLFIKRMCQWIIEEYIFDDPTHDQTLFDNLHKLGFTDEEMKKS